MAVTISNFKAPVAEFTLSGTPATVTSLTAPNGTAALLVRPVGSAIRVAYDGGTDAGAQGSEFFTLAADRVRVLPILDDTDPTVYFDSDVASVHVEVLAVPFSHLHLAQGWNADLALTASSTLITDTGAYFTGATLEAAMAELGAYRVYEATLTITAAQLRALNATPITVIAAPGAGKYIDVIECHWFLDYGGVQMDAAAAGDTLVLKYTNGSGAAITDAIAGDTIGGATADYHTTALRVPELVPVTNALVCAHINSGEWYAEAGTSELKVSVLYRIRTQPT